MKDKKHIKSFNEATENLNISDVIERLIQDKARGFLVTSAAPASAIYSRFLLKAKRKSMERK